MFVEVFFGLVVVALVLTLFKMVVREELELNLGVFFRVEAAELARRHRTRQLLANVVGVFLSFDEDQSRLVDLLLKHERHIIYQLGFFLGQLQKLLHEPEDVSAEGYHCLFRESGKVGLVLPKLPHHLDELEIAEVIRNTLSLHAFLDWWNIIFD